MKKYDNLRATPFTQEQIDLIIGSILGDGCLHRDNNKGNFKLRMSQCEKQKQYFLFKFDKLKPFVNTFYKSIDKRGNSIMYQTATICHQDLNKYAKMFYDASRIKHIPENIEDLLNPIGLAIWIMDDGNLHENVNMRICTMGFNYQENLLLQKALKNKFNLDCSIKDFKYKTKLYYQLYFNKENTINLSNIILPYMEESMKYKIILKPSETIR